MTETNKIKGQHLKIFSYEGVFLELSLIDSVWHIHMFVIFGGTLLYYFADFPELGFSHDVQLREELQNRL